MDGRTGEYEGGWWINRRWMDEQVNGFQIGSWDGRGSRLAKKYGFPLCLLEQPSFLRVLLPPISWVPCRPNTENSSGSPSPFSSRLCISGSQMKEEWPKCTELPLCARHGASYFLRRGFV